MRKLLRLYKNANAGHIGSSLSCLVILIYLFFHEKKTEDQVILSKGHAAAALYTVLATSGHFPETELDSFYQDGTFLAAHPPCSKQIPGISFGTGSLGHGLSLATGIAFSTRFTDHSKRVYCILSDGDLNAGSTWEAALFAGHHQLQNLVVIIDNNGLQGFGRTDEVLTMEPIKSKWEAFNFEVITVPDGNDFHSLENGFMAIAERSSHKPICIIAKTVKGSGVSFMEDRLEWHYLPMRDDQYQVACDEIHRLEDTQGTP